MTTVRPEANGPDQCVGILASTTFEFEGGLNGETAVERGSWLIAIMFSLRSISRDGLEREGNLTSHYIKKEGTCVPINKGLFDKAHKLKCVLCSGSVNLPFPTSESQSNIVVKKLPSMSMSPYPYGPEYIHVRACILAIQAIRSHELQLPSEREGSYGYMSRDIRQL